MQWLNEPPSWQLTDGNLTMTTAPKTDYWRKTQHGFIADNGHFLADEIRGDFEATIVIKGAYQTLYDQAGLMVRVDESIWMKCGIEYVDGVQYASAVVTRDFSDWSVAPLAPAPEQLTLRVKRMGSTLEVAYASDGETFILLRSCYLPMDEIVRVGPMACSPGEQGFMVELRNYSIVQ